MSLDSLVQLVFNVYEAFTVALFVEDDKKLSCLSAYSFARSFDKARTVAMEGTLPGWVVKHREPLIIGNFDKDEDALGYYGKKEEIKSFMAYPLEIPGVIVVDGKKKWAFNEKEKKVLPLFVSLFAQEVERVKQIRDMEEEREHFALTRRILGFMRESREDESVLEEVLNEGLALSGGDLALVGVETKGRMRIVGVAGGGDDLVGAESLPRTSIVSMIEGGRELLLPYESGYLRERPLVFPDETVRARQYFGFPLMSDERAYGVLGFASLSQRRLREGAIGALRDMAGLLSLFLVRSKARGDLEASAKRDPVTGALRFGPLIGRLTEMAEKKMSFTVVSIKLPGFVLFRRKRGIEAADAILRKMYHGIDYCMGGRGTVVAIHEGAHFYVATKSVDAQEGKNMLKILRFTILRDLAPDVAVAKGDIEIGTALFPKDSEDPWELLDIAENRGAGTTAQLY
jgi:GGDEF domain-containing protein